MTKRVMDILFASIAFIVLLPVLIPVIIILRFTGQGHVFYRQERVGRGGRTFGLYKFVTMLENSPNLPGGLLTTQHDPRILPFGRVLRATEINELPQLVNVLLGDMSLIGPRPQAKPHFDVFPAHVKKEIIRVRPGLSGIGSIFFRDETNILARCGKDAVRFYAEDIAPYKGELEIYYAKRQSTSLDVLLLLLTLWVVLYPKSRLHMKLLPGLPHPTSKALAGCLGISPATEAGEQAGAGVPATELDVRDLPARMGLPVALPRLEVTYPSAHTCTTREIPPLVEGGSRQRILETSREDPINVR